MKINKSVFIGVLVAVVILIAGIVIFPISKGTSVKGVGEPTGFDNVNLTGSLYVGAPVGSVSTSGYGDGTVYSTKGLVEGGIDAIATTSTSYTLVASDFLTPTYISFTANGGNTTVTLPASSTLNTAGYLANAGDCSIEMIYNASSTAGVTLTIAGGAGTSILNASSTKVVTSKGAATMRICRKADTDYLVLMANFI